MERQSTDRTVSNLKAGTMESGAATLDEQAGGEIPEDVAILYSWANLQGAKYRDFSASRREYRAQMRHRAAAELHDQELKIATPADPAATSGETEIAEVAGKRAEAGQADAQPDRDRLLSMRDAGQATRKASAERFEAQRLADAVALARSAAQEREIDDPQASSIRQATRDAYSEERLRQSGPTGVVPGKTSDPYSPQVLAEGEYFELPGTPAAELQPSRFRQQREYIERATGVEIPPPRSGESPGPGYRPPGYRPEKASDLREVARPAQVAPAATEDTLQHARERVAARWYALKGVFQQPELNVSADPPRSRQDHALTPILAVFSLAGGVGKTSLVATLGRALSAQGEQVLLADTTSHGLLPFYFGANALIPGVVRNFAPPFGSNDAPVYLVSYDVDRRGEIQTREDRRNEDAGTQDKLAADLLRDSQGTDRVLLDLPATSSWVLRRVARMNPTILIPLAPDMNSVITLQSLNQFLQSIQDADGHALSPHFILNQFDPALPLHIDVREVLRQQLGESLLPFVIHRSPAISESLAEGMTVLDYAPDSVAAQDYCNVATWVRSVSAATGAGLRNLRWSER